MDSSVARRMWLVGEPIHAITYFAPESFAAWEAAGVRGFWRGYFATRAAPLGPVGPGVVTATFFNFAPSMVERAIPEVWSMCTPAAALDARSSGAAAALRAIDASVADAAASATSVLERVVDDLPVAGRPLYAANADLPWPTDPVERLWHALTLLREHRGDGHNAALVAAGIDGCAAHVLAGAAGGATRDTTQPARGWTDDEWTSSAAGLEERGLLDAAGSATPAGADLHARVEAATDEAAMAPWSRSGADGAAAVESALRPLATAIVGSGIIRFPNPMGLPALDAR